MKSRFYLAFVLAGIAPVVGLAGFYLYSAMNQDVSSPKASSAATASVNVQQQQVEVQSISSSVLNAIKSTNVDAESLASNSGATALQNFVGTHPGVSGIAIVNAAGKAALTVPSTVSLIDSNYGSNPEFSKIQSKLAENGGKNYEFYTSHFGYPAFVFAVPLAKSAFAEVVLNISTFFKGTSAIGQYFILDGGSGHYLYHSDASKLNTDFNPQHESWLNTVLTDISAQKSGASAGSSAEAVYSYLGVGKFGVVHVFPLTIAASAPSVAKHEPADISELLMTPMSLGFVLAFALLFIGAGIASRKLIAPFRRAVNVILAAADDSKTLTPEIVKSFGNDEAGQIIQALSLYNEKIQQSKNNEIRNMSDQMGGMQRQTRQYQAEAQEKAQQLADKLKEIEALKGMSEGLRNQNEQSKQEIGRVKGDLAEAQTAQLELTGLQGKYAQLQTQLKAAEEKVIKAGQAASTIQISAVRAAAIRTMSEELKNTLGIIKGYVSSVIGAGQGGVNEKQQEFLGMVINRSARLEKFINDLVDIYQVEIESKDAKMEEVNLASEIETFAFNFQTQTELKNLKIKVEAKPGLPKVPVVRRRMTQLWNVLYLQLIKDAPKGSTIPIVVEAVGDTVKVTVQDPGLIVAPESLPRMFDEFYDPKHPASPQLAGTGLKLALVKTILNAHGGNAVAEKADPGTRLILTFATKARAAGIASVEPATEVKASPIVSPTAPAKPVGPKLDLDETFGVKPTAPSVSSAGPGTIPDSPSISSVPGITVGAKPPAVPGAPSGTPSALPPIPGLTVGAKPPAGSSTPTAPLPPIAGLTIGAKPPAGDGSSLPPLPPIAGLTVGAKPPSAGVPVPAAPGVPPKPVPVPGILDALISGKIPSVTAPAMRPPSAPAAAPPAMAPPVLKPAGPIPPPPSVPGAPKPMVSTSLEDLLKMKNAAPPKNADDLLE